VARAGVVGADPALTFDMDRGASPVDGTAFEEGRNPQDLLSDPETGLFSQAYFDVALEARIAAARRRLRPVALVLLDIVRGLASEEAEPADAGLVTIALRRTLREADTACRLDDGRFALVLEDTPENGAIWTVERIRGHLVESGIIHTVWAGVACYPAHAFDRDEIMSQATEALAQAKEWRQDRIEVASAD
jgi:diguanylate cyclase (GGDEF)-like protein